MASRNRVVKVAIDEALLGDLDDLSRRRGVSRSATMRTACREFVMRIRAEELDNAYERGYERMPEAAAPAEAQVAVALEVLPKETW